MKLFNTLSRQVEDFQPLNPPAVQLYACGPTVYDFTHLGHIRKYVMDDVLVRTLRHGGYQVKHVMNVTDVGHLVSDDDTGEDKLEKGSKKTGLDVWQLAKKFTDYFFYSLQQVNVAKPDIVAKVTDYIEDQLALVEQLEAKGYTYIIEGDGIYFDTSLFPDYGQLARRTAADIEEGARIGKVEGKRNPTDFALWKFERPGENRQMAWPSPWAERSFPGWHIECSAISMKLLGEQIDVHTGGIDHISVHHPNEIAQSEAATGKKPFVRYWIHHNMLLIEGEKMSKSLGNFATIDDVLKRQFSPLALRLYLMGTHYRSEMNFTWENLAGINKAWQKLIAQLAKVQPTEKLSNQAQQYQQQFWQWLEDDLKTSEAISVFWQMMKSDLAEAEKKALALDFDQVLQIGLTDVQKWAEKYPLEKETLSLDQLPDEVQALIKQRGEARSNKNWQLADEIRKKVIELGYEVIDLGSVQRIYYLQ